RFKCDVKKDYERFLRLETCFMDKIMKVASLMRAIFDLWRRRMCRSLLKNDTSKTINSEDIFKFIDETVKENCERQSIAVMISDVYNIKFDNTRICIIGIFKRNSCAEITTIPKNVYDQFPNHLKEKLNRNAKVFRVQGIHNSESSTEGSLMLKLTICNSDHKDLEIEAFIDLLSNIPLLCYNHLKKFNINPINLGFKKGSYQFRDARTEPESRVLLDNDYEPGNKLWAKFTVTEDYVPTRPKMFPVSNNIEHLVLKELEETISKGWLKKVKNGTLVENINQMVVVKKIDDEGNIKVRICHACLNVNKYIKLPELPELPNAKELLLMHGPRLISGITIPKQRLQALLGIECPDTPSALKRVIAKFQYFSMTVPNFPILVKPLHKQSIGEGKLSDNEGCKSLSVYLACTRYAIASLMTCDYDDGSHRPFAFGGRSLICHEINYLEGTKLLLHRK
uniref:Uncharacterized protein n=1 Tax=Strongyloides stercoralis TaxID=6248 RepID=A0AAF5DS70_STRER